MKNLPHICLVIPLALCGTPVTSQSIAPEADALFLKVKALDTQLFDAYNHCDLTTLGGMVSDDLEFYHDQTGLSALEKRPSLPPSSRTSAGR